jgi:hypothetical protein
MSFVAMINRSVDDSCGILKLCGKNSSMSTMRSLAVVEMYTFRHRNDAWRGPTNIHVAHGAPTYVGYLVSRVQLFCILAEEMLFCCNPRGRGSGQRRIVADVVLRFGGYSM